MTGGPPDGFSHGRKKARIEIIPLIDVIFFLLATFVLFILSLHKIQSIPLDLPQTRPSARLSPDDAPVVLQVSDARTAYWNQQPITFEEIAPRLRGYKLTSPNPRVLVAGDNRAKYGDTVEAYDLVLRAGITQVTFETVDRPTGR